MALGHLLWVSWISSLLFDGSSGLPTIKGYGYPYIADSHNMGGDAEDQVLTSPTFDQNNWQASDNQLTGPEYTYYNMPPAEQPDWIPSQQNLPNADGAPDVEKPLNGDPQDWGIKNLDQPLVFPLSPNYQQSALVNSEPGPVQPQSAPLGVLYTNSVPADPAAYYQSAPSSISQAAESPSFESLQPEPVGSGYGVADFDTGSSAAEDDLSEIPHLVYEDIFQYPENPEPFQSSGAISDTAEGYDQAYPMSKGPLTGYASPLEERSFPSYPANVEAQPVYPSGMGSLSSSLPGGEDLNSGQMDYQPRDEIFWNQVPLTSTQTVDVSRRLGEATLPQSYIVKSRNEYQRLGYLYNKSRAKW